MQITQHTGLVLEGGGMRGVFTAGVLDALMKNEVYFPYVVAVSAGALRCRMAASLTPISCTNGFLTRLSPLIIRPTKTILLLSRW